METLNFKTKRLYKKKCKIYSTLFYIFAALFLSVVIFTGITITAPQIISNGVIIVILGLFSIIGILIFSAISVKYLNLRKQYLLDINDYRKYLAANKLIQMYKDKDYENFINLCNNKYDFNTSQLKYILSNIN